MQGYKQSWGVAPAALRNLLVGAGITLGRGMELSLLTREIAMKAT